jgi:hypothetical protein
VTSRALAPDASPPELTVALAEGAAVGDVAALEPLSPEPVSSTQLVGTTMTGFALRPTQVDAAAETVDSKDTDHSDTLVTQAA